MLNKRVGQDSKKVMKWVSSAILVVTDENVSLGCFPTVVSRAILVKSYYHDCRCLNDNCQCEFLWEGI